VNVFNNLSQIGELMKSAGKIRETVEKTTEAVQVEATAGGGAVTAKVNGRLELLAVRIDPKLIADGDTELLEDMIVAAVNQAQTKARDETAKALQSLVGGLPLGGLTNLLGGGGGERR
jgi:DNA-binding YbaB/EbfC family protein